MPLQQQPTTNAQRGPQHGGSRVPPANPPAFNAMGFEQQRAHLAKGGTAEPHELALHLRAATNDLAQHRRALAKRVPQMAGHGVLGVTMVRTLLNNLPEPADTSSASIDAAIADHDRGLVALKRAADQLNGQARDLKKTAGTAHKAAAAWLMSGGKPAHDALAKLERRDADIAAPEAAAVVDLVLADFAAKVQHLHRTRDAMNKAAEAVLVRDGFGRVSEAATLIKAARTGSTQAAEQLLKALTGNGADPR